MKKPTAQLRSVLESNETLLVPGCYDALTAKILKQAGFEVIYMTGSGVTASVIGWPDVGVLTMVEMVNQARNIVTATGLPLICDADNGYGNALNLVRTMQEFERAGIAGIHLEDQVFPKRCGHFEGKQVIPSEEMVKKIEAALYAREDEDFFLIARTDSRSVLGIEEAIRRAKLYYGAGADMIFLEAPHSVEELKETAKAMEGIPTLVNMVEGGKTPILPFEDLKEMGFNIVLYPTAGIRAVMKVYQEFAEHLKKNFNTQDFEERLVSFSGRNEITGLARIKELEERFL